MILHKPNESNPWKISRYCSRKKTKDKKFTFNLDENQIKCETEVKLLGVAIAFKLNFNEHISNICKKASRQLNVLKRICKNLTKLGK